MARQNVIGDMDVGDMYREIGDAAFAESHLESSCGLLLKAALAYHFAQFLHCRNQEGHLLPADAVGDTFHLSR